MCGIDSKINIAKYIFIASLWFTHYICHTMTTHSPQTTPPNRSIRPFILTHIYMCTHTNIKIYISYDNLTMTYIVYNHLHRTPLVIRVLLQVHHCYGHFIYMKLNNLYTLHFTLYTLLFTFYSLLFTLYSLLFTLYSLHFTS
jgi:hypothetical protein